MGDAAIDDTSQPPARFPTEWTLFARNFQGSFGYTLELGIERDHPLFAVRLHSNFALFGRPAVVIHAGATKDGPRVGVVKDATLSPLRPRDFNVLIPPAGETRMDDEDDSRNIKIEVRAALLDVFPPHKFSVTAGYGDQANTEAFEWRHSMGKEVTDLSGGMAAGWKLVRLGAAAAEEGSSDGLEVVGVWVTGRQNLKEAMKFRLLNSGANGVLGDTFSYAAAVTAVGMWDHERRKKMENDPGRHP